MNLTQKLLTASAASLLLASGSYAAAIDVTIDIAGTVSGVDTGTVSGSGTGTYDDVTGELSFQSSVTTATGFTGATIVSDVQILGLAGISTAVSCTYLSGMLNICTGTPPLLPDPLPIGVPAATTYVTNNLFAGTNDGNGEIASSVSNSGVVVDITYTVSADSTPPGAPGDGELVIPNDPPKIPTMPIYGLGLTVLGLLTIAGRRLRKR